MENDTKQFQQELTKRMKGKIVTGINWSQKSMQLTIFSEDGGMLICDFDEDNIIMKNFRDQRERFDNIRRTDEKEINKMRCEE